MSDDAVFALAQAAGLSRDWISAAGEPMQVAPDTLRAILSNLGFPCDSEDQCRESMCRLEELNAADRLPPLVTGVVGHSLPMPSTLAGKTWRIEMEDGTGVNGRFDGDGWISLPAIPVYGYHRLLVDDAVCTLAIAPPRCYGIVDALAASGVGISHADPRLWGLAVQLYSLRRRGDGGIGDYQSLAALAQSAARHGAAALAISPVHAMFSADLQRYSPYGPSSRLFLNALHVAPEAALGSAAYEAALAALGPYAAQRLAHFETLELIDWPQAADLRLQLLRTLYRLYRNRGDTREFDTFRAQHGNALKDHARFEALHAWHLARGESGYWRHWAEGLRNPRAADVERFAREHDDEISFHCFLQWQAAKGLSAAQHAAREAGMPIGLVTDLAVGADNGGSQAWSRQQEMINGLSVGAPPDLMNPRGQSWGLGAFSPHAMKAKGFGAYIEMLRSIFAYGGGARIDHVLGLTRLWLVPDGAGAEQGAYLKYPIDDLLRLIALESWRHKAIVIGENLGTVPPGFNDTLAASGLLGIQVLLFEQDNGRFKRPEQWSKEAIATTTTHDTPTVAGWWSGRDLAWREKLDLLEKGQSAGDALAARKRECDALWQAMVASGFAHGDKPEAVPLDAALDFMSATPAPLAMLPIEDALGAVEQPNLPGTVDSHPNWRRRLPHDVADILNTQAVSDRLAIMNKTRCFSGGIR